MAAGYYNKDGTGRCDYELEDDEVWITIKNEEDYPPCLDFDDKKRKGKKGKYLKDWE